MYIYIRALMSPGQPLQSRTVKFGPDKMKSSTRFYFSILNACYLISFQLILLSKIMVGFFLFVWLVSVCLFVFSLIWFVVFFSDENVFKSGAQFSLFLY